jgi:hypothetical protein
MNSSEIFACIEIIASYFWVLRVSGSVSDRTGKAKTRITGSEGTIVESKERCKLTSGSRFHNHSKTSSG